MRDKRRRRKKKATARSEQKLIDLILRAAFMGEDILLQATIMMYSDDYKKYPIYMVSSGRIIAKFYVPAMSINRHKIHSYGGITITPRKALEFLNEHKAHVVYPKID